MKNKLLKQIKVNKTPKRNSKFNYKVIISILLVVLHFLTGILMVFFGIRDTYNLNRETKNYIITNGYYRDYEVYSNDQDGITYKLIYVYKVDDIEYYISTDYGTEYIPHDNSIREVKYNPENPQEAILVGTNSKNGLIFIGVFFILVSFNFILFGLNVLGYFNKVKLDISEIYTGVLLFVVGIGIILLENGTTMSFMETIRSFGLWIIIPIIFIIVGIYQIFRNLLK